MRHLFSSLAALIILSIFSTLPVVAQLPFDTSQPQMRWTQPEPNLGPVVLDPALRRPFLFVREITNRKWPAGKFFVLLLLTASLAKLMTPEVVASCLLRMRQKFFVSVAFALLYSTVLLGAARVGFRTDGFEPFALLCIGLVQGGFVVGLALGANLFASILHQRFNFGVGADWPDVAASVPKLKRIRYSLAYAFCLLLIVALLTLISTVPEFWRFPRIGNRVIILVAMIGLGGLICDLRLRLRGER